MVNEVSYNYVERTSPDEQPWDELVSLRTRPEPTNNMSTTIGTFQLNEYIVRRHNNFLTGRLAQLVEHNVSGLYRCGFEYPAGQLKLLIVFRMRR